MRCEALDCGRVILARGLCGLHYKRMRAGKSLVDFSKGQQSLPRGGLAELDLHKHHPFYLAWVNMKTRCDNPKSTQWQWYGARGISYDGDWKAFAQFYHDMWEGWFEGGSLDRKHNDLNYSKINCHWVPLSEQARNRRSRAS